MMLRWFLNTWDAVWPNLLASVIWTIPVLFVQYWRLKYHHIRVIDELRRELRGDDSAGAD